ncbi:SGNH/GDSL hydrolase family protein [Lentilactobacillus sp. SPB1-3]|uniref:SGNH/GDSL hydrolase family protein n=1 Tax=Lentilactobacillus terminaliae TaxID=3003483 RepID=A0ACD5DG42_9LACO|nr:SGNH/GDSL hydrolase family protein [Lentilactobacillus sp. SPB1-3]MCZ0976448.1 SGNH/GDSL hydrolase family protein [Lentilactobacillus sp. SPB1-3]
MKIKMISRWLVVLAVSLIGVIYPTANLSQGFKDQYHSAEAESSQGRSSKVQTPQPRNLKKHTFVNKHFQVTSKIDGVMFRQVNAIPVYVNDQKIMKSYPNTIWYKVGESIDGSLSQVKGSNRNNVIVVPQGAIKNIATQRYNVALPNTNKLRKKTVLFLGDSITKGYNGSYTYKHASFPLWVHKYLQVRVHKEGHIRSSITGDSFNDLFTILPHVNFKNTDDVVIEYGTNDYRHSNKSLDQVTNGLATAIKYIRKQNPNVKIYGIIPLPRFDFYNMSTALGSGGYTFPDLQKGLAQTYHDLGVNTYNVAKVHPDFVNTSNFYQKYYDHRVHPTCQTYQQFGLYLSQWLQQQLNK